MHLAAGTSVERIGDHEFVLSRGEHATTLACWGTSGVKVTEGSVSDRFGERQRATVLVADVHGPMPLRFGWRFAPAETHVDIAVPVPEWLRRHVETNRLRRLRGGCFGPFVSTHEYGRRCVRSPAPATVCD